MATASYVMIDNVPYSVNHPKVLALQRPSVVVSDIKTGSATNTAKRIRQSSKPLMNKLEEDFFEYLKSVYPSRTVHCQAIRFRLGNGIWYKPDFLVFPPITHAYEVKGSHAFRGGFENLKVAAGLYPDITWYLVWKVGNSWEQQTILP